jgi:hypothetical protein
MLAAERVHAALQGVHAQRQRFECVGNLPAFLRAHAVKSSPCGQMITMHLHCSLGG